MDISFSVTTITCCVYRIKKKQPWPIARKWRVQRWSRTTVDGERFTGLNICSFSAIKVFTEVLCIALVTNTHHLIQLKRGTYIHGKTFAVLLKTVQTQKFSPVNLFPFTVCGVYIRIYIIIYILEMILKNCNFKKRE